ncbi:hypothetical protein TNCV_3207291 [Trichonephila clavipes]|nr:hypothetical protein TNCV_3207291 [Trichonephila clavipes]
MPELQQNFSTYQEVFEASSLALKLFTLSLQDMSATFQQDRRFVYNHKIGHDNLEKKICRVCRKTCDDRSSLTRHFLKNHGEPPYRCSECPSIFSRLYDRNTHIQKHILRCELCKIPMKSQDELFYHNEKVHQTNNMDHVPVLTPLLEYPDNAYIGKCDSSDSMAESSSSDD